MSLSIQGLGNRSCDRIGRVITGFKRLNDPTARVLAAVTGDTKMCPGTTDLARALELPTLIWMIFRALKALITSS